eukprot:TRINITY_DN26772_c0_g1_i2.p1 TRINITY_DN26772_c0_g1~~TRINITY_DN26772_c0_g1_i2.p1  ORF type:complete len:108 (-),score=14.99 TRINITY_DN26772_c0_g1_i2:158-481(-)
MTMQEALEATLQIMSAPSSAIKTRTSYNLTSLSFTPHELVEAVQNVIPEFQVEYNVDPVRQQIADSVPSHLELEDSQNDWGWKPRITTPAEFVDEMLHVLGEARGCH